MLRFWKKTMERANVNRLFHAFAVLVVAGSLIFASKDSIRKGQVIKQFFAYSITQSLVENHWNGLETTVPCPDVSGKSPRRWVEENSK